MLPRRRVLLSCLLPARGYRGLSALLSLQTWNETFQPAPSSPPRQLSAGASALGKVRGGGGAGLGADGFFVSTNDVRQVGFTRRSEAGFWRMGGAFHGRKLVRRRRKDSPDAPRAGRGGGRGWAGVGQMVAQLASCAGAGSPRRRALEPRGVVARRSSSGGGWG